MDNRQELKQNADKLVEGLMGVIGIADKMVKGHFDGMSPEAAKEFAKAFKNANLPDQLAKARAEAEGLKDKLKNL